MADDDPAPAARAEPAAGRRRIEDHPAVRAGNADGYGRGQRARHLGHDRFGLDRRKAVALGAVQAQEPAQERDRPPLLAAAVRPGQPSVPRERAEIRPACQPRRRRAGLRPPAGGAGSGASSCGRARQGPNGSGRVPWGMRHGAGAAGGARVLILKIRWSSARQASQQDAATSSASRLISAIPRSSEATPSRNSATTSGDGGLDDPSAARNRAAAWSRRSRAAASQSLAFRAARNARSTAPK